MQIIRGSDLMLTQDLSALRGFGTSLASGVDVDLNTYNGKYITRLVIDSRGYAVYIFLSVILSALNQWHTSLYHVTA